MAETQDQYNRRMHQLLDYRDEDAKHYTQAQLDQAVAIAHTEVERLKAGKFTSEEFQNLCHGLSEDDKTEFFAGCTEYQCKLFGESAVAVERARADDLENRSHQTVIFPCGCVFRQEGLDAEPHLDHCKEGSTK